MEGSLQLGWHKKEAEIGGPTVQVESRSEQIRPGHSSVGGSGAVRMKTSE